MYLDKYYKGTDKAAVLARLILAAKNIGCSPEDLDTVIFKESTWNPEALNPDTKAASLTQFLPSTAKSMFGITAEQIRVMPAVQQFQYIEKYFLYWKKALKANFTDVYELYLCNFHPAAVNKPDSYIILDAAKNLKGFNANKGLDANANGQITKGEVKAWFSLAVKKKTLSKA